MPDPLIHSEITHSGAVIDLVAKVEEEMQKPIRRMIEKSANRFI